MSNGKSTIILPNFRKNLSCDIGAQGYFAPKFKLRFFGISFVGQGCEEVYSQTKIIIIARFYRFHGYNQKTTLCVSSITLRDRVSYHKPENKDIFSLSPWGASLCPTDPPTKTPTSARTIGPRRARHCGMMVQNPGQTRPSTVTRPALSPLNRVPAWMPGGCCGWVMAWLPVLVSVEAVSSCAQGVNFMKSACAGAKRLQS